MKLMVRIILLIAGAYCWADQGLLLAQNSLRESCRLEMAGLYLNLENQVRRDQQYQEELLRKINLLNRGQMKEKAALTALVAEKGHDSPEVYQQSLKVQNILATLVENSEFLQTTKKSLQENEQHLQQFKKNIQGVFKLQKVPEKGLLPFKLVYESNCPDFQVNCPISHNAAKKLRNMLGANTPENCVRFAGFSGASG